MPRRAHRLAFLLCLALAACAVPVPSGPTILALPGQGKSLVQFQEDDFGCRQYASGLVNGQAQYASQGATGTAAASTLIGGAAGAAIGAAAGNPALGAAVGGGTGLLFGSASGANAAAYSAYGLQRQYDVAYAQCMTAAGDGIPQPQSYAAYGAYPYFYGYGYGYGYPYPPYTYLPTPYGYYPPY